MALIIAGDRSGVGKTTVTLALLAALVGRGAGSQTPSPRVQSFKVGPDYIDPMFHRAVTGRVCRNLDPLLTSEAYVGECFARHSADAEAVVIEGVMGLFDGVGTEARASTAHVARLLGVPVLLVVDCRGLSGSVAAIVHGYLSLDPRIKLAGVVLNRVAGDRHLELLQEALAPLPIPILGVIQRQEAIAIPHRHLGLVPTAELPHLEQLFDHLAHLGRTCFDWPRLEPLCRSGPIAPRSPAILSPHGGEGPRIAVAQDPAFSFYYGDNLDLLRDLGAELMPWSPCTDPCLPPQTQGLYIGGGFPEMFAPALAANLQARASVGQGILRGLPTYAECGGLMYLGEELMDFDGRSWPMVGALPLKVQMMPHLTLGYREATVLRSTPFLTPGTLLWGHEFHRSIPTQVNPAPVFQLRSLSRRAAPGLEGWGHHGLQASYLHLHWGGYPEIPHRFLQAAATFQPTPSGE